MSSAPIGAIAVELIKAFENVPIDWKWIIIAFPVLQIHYQKVTVEILSKINSPISLFLMQTIDFKVV
jgi:hypothetical protein